MTQCLYFLLPFILPLILRVLDFDKYDLKKNWILKYLVFISIFAPVVLVLFNRLIKLFFKEEFLGLLDKITPNNLSAQWEGLKTRLEKYSPNSSHSLEKEIAPLLSLISNSESDPSKPSIISDCPDVPDNSVTDAIQLGKINKKSLLKSFKKGTTGKSIGIGLSTKIEKPSIPSFLKKNG